MSKEELLRNAIASLEANNDVLTSLADEQRAYIDELLAENDKLKRENNNLRQTYE